MTTALDKSKVEEFDLDIIIKNPKERFRARDERITKLMMSVFYELGRELIKFRDDREAWESMGYTRFEDYAGEKFGQGVRHLKRLIRGTLVIDVLEGGTGAVLPSNGSETGVPMLPMAEYIARPITDYVAKFNQEERELVDSNGTVISKFMVPVSIRNEADVREQWKGVITKYAEQKTKAAEPKKYRLTQSKVYKFLSPRYRTGHSLVKISDSRNVAKIQRKAQAFTDSIAYLPIWHKNDISAEDLTIIAKRENWSDNDLKAIRAACKSVAAHLEPFRAALALVRL